MKKSPKELSLERQIQKRLTAKPLQAVTILFEDPEVHSLQEYANIVSIKRLGFNDHGPVHMKKAALNSIIMFDLLREGGVKFNLEQEECGTAQDSLTAVIISALLHDIGMTVAREKHEFMSITLATPIINRVLEEIYGDDIAKLVMVRSLALEGIFGHMATQTVHSLEAGLVLIGDGCDMEKGRARIPQLLSDKPKVGDIHRYASTAIKKVSFSKGEKKPVKIEVLMTQSVGYFQVEEVLYPKIYSSSVKPYIELYAGIENGNMLKYL